MRGTKVARPGLTAALSTPTVLFVLVAAGYVAGYQLSSEVFSAEGQNASFFPPAGVTLAALVLVERSRWPIVLAAAGVGGARARPRERHRCGKPRLRPRERRRAARRCSSPRVARRPGRPASDAAPRRLPRRGGRRRARRGRPHRRDDVRARRGNEGWARFAFEWWSGDGLAVLVVGGALVALRAYTRLPTRRLVEAVVIASLAVAATASVFLFGWFPFVYVPVAVLVVLAFRAGTTAVAITSALVAFVAAGATAEADDFWASVDVTPANRILYLQLALAVIVAAVLGAAEIAQRERIVRRLARSEAEHEAARAARARAELLEGHVGRLSSAVQRRRSRTQRRPAWRSSAQRPRSSTRSARAIWSRSARPCRLASDRSPGSLSTPSHLRRMLSDAGASWRCRPGARGAVPGDRHRRRVAGRLGRLGAAVERGPTADRRHDHARRHARLVRRRTTGGGARTGRAVRPRARARGAAGGGRGGGRGRSAARPPRRGARAADRRPRPREGARPCAHRRASAVRDRSRRAR